jgi:hypothetical protein
MRRRYFLWTIAVFGIIGTAYGASSLIYNFKKGEGLFISGLILLIIGIIALLVFLFFFSIQYVSNKNKMNAPIPSEFKEEKVIEEDKDTKETASFNEKSEIEQEKKREYFYKAERNERTSYRYSVSTIYVKQVGYGPILRIDGNRILDMRTNTYYRIENNMVNQEGYGPVFEISGNQIKNAFGGYLYELSGSNINKIFGGFYASISGNYITLYDLSVKYEITDSMSKNQILAVAALLFGKY